jgi:hypothetical protein
MKSLVWLSLGVCAGFLGGLLLVVCVGECFFGGFAFCFLEKDSLKSRGPI